LEYKVGVTSRKRTQVKRFRIPLATDLRVTRISLAHDRTGMGYCPVFTPNKAITHSGSRPARAGLSPTRDASRN
jgi:hypothetical protein